MKKYILTAIICLIAICDLRAQKVAFPGSESEAMSPNRRYTIRNTDNDQKQPAHVLSIIDTKNNVSTKVYTYGRHVEVMWSPRSTAIAVNDFEGSDSARPIIIARPWGSQILDLREQLAEFVKAHEKSKNVLENGHVYVTVDRWLGDDEVLCNVKAYGDANPKGFASQYVYNLKKGFRFSRVQTDSN